MHFLNIVGCGVTTRSDVKLHRVLPTLPPGYTPLTEKWTKLSCELLIGSQGNREKLFIHEYSLRCDLAHDEL